VGDRATRPAPARRVVTDDVVRSQAEAATLARAPLVVLEPVEALLDELGIGAGPVTATPLGDGHSNVTYLLTRGNERVVLRRPPRPPYAESAHDVLREARLLELLHAAGIPVPRALAIVDDTTLLGVPFVVMQHVPGHAISTTVPPQLDQPAEHARIGDQQIDALAQLHALDVSTGPLAEVGKPSGYLERQLRRFSAIWNEIATRPIPDLDTVTEWLAEHRPQTTETTLVHGDYRLGNVLFAPHPPARLTAVLDWEMATLGDPLADLGYLCATWAQPDDHQNPMLALSAATRGAGFPTRAQLRERYAERTGRTINEHRWYEVLALWKAAIFLEASYRRYLAGNTSDPYFATLRDGIPSIAADALNHTHEPIGS
jgi:aminoglycoside phosphotransferase (APT) family kinase protein